MQTARRFLLSRWTYSLLGVVLLGGVVWTMGPLLSWLEDALPRSFVVVAMLAVWAGANLLITLRDRRRDDALSTGVSAAGISHAEEAGERAAIAAKMTAALALLKRTRGTRGYLYEQPWYAIIGPPGAGKTTALLNAGLDFPLAGAIGGGAVAGVGGTRLCEWWFTDQAVLIDTAGRYTTQDSHAAVDRAGWEAFLDLLKRTRPRQPLNGVIVAIALNDVAQATPAERSAHARAIGARIGELESRFKLRLPVYAVFTKADLLAGFMEFFDDLDRDARGQVWGTTFPYDTAAPVGDFATAFRDLVARLGRRLLDRLQAERNPAARALMVGFPTQLASLESALTEFVTQAFGASGDQPATLLRGVYLTSATQEGTPIDRLTGAIARAFGLVPEQSARLRPQAGRAYFLTQLLKEVVFNEATLVGAGPARARRHRMVTATCSAIAALLVLGAGGALWHAYSVGKASIDAASAGLAAYEQATNGLPLDPVADADLAALAPLLDQARAAVPVGPGDKATGVMSFLSQDEKLAEGQRILYRHALERALFPRLIWRLETQLRGRLNDPEFLYEATRVTLMLGSQGPLDADLVREWMKVDWQIAYPGILDAPLRAALARHLDALLAQPLPPVTLDGELVEQARATFGQVSLAQRIYSRLRPAAQNVPAWKPSDPLGRAGVDIFVRASGRPLDEGVPGFYTRDGFHKVVLPNLDNAVRQVASESWVLGKKVELDPQGEQMHALEQDTIGLYETDYARTWDAMLADLNLAPLRSLAQAAQDLYIISSDYSPMRALLADIARQLTLSEPPTQAHPAAGAAPGVDTTALRFQAVQGAQPLPQASRPGHEIDARYQALRDLVGTGGGGAPVDRVMKTIGDLQQQLAKLAASGTGTRALPGKTAEDPAVALQLESQRQPQPFARWLATIASSGAALRAGDTRQQVVAAYNAPGGPAALCAATVNAHYPFVPGAATETPIGDFARLFAPGGVLDGFFNTLLRPYVDTKGSVWRPQSADGGNPPLSAADAAQFQRAADIRDLFFMAGRSTPGFRFDITPVSLDAKANQVTLEVSGTIITYNRGAARSTELTWSGDDPTQIVRLGFEPPPAGGAVEWREGGSWALFRLFSRGKFLPGAAADHAKLVFDMADRQAVFDLRLGARNPLAAGVLQGFKCPAVQ